MLFDAPIAASVRARVRSHFLTGPANGCFVLQRSRSLRSLAGLDGAALTHWDRQGDTVAFRLSSSPDAMHQVRAMMVGGTLRGSGSSSSAYAAENRAGDVVFADRIGPPDLARCTDVRPPR